MVVEQLTRLGLNEKEAEVYLAALQLGLCTVNNIAEKAEINRTTAYTHIKSLISQGLITSRDYLGKNYLVAEKPDRLKQIWEDREREVQRRKDTLNSLLPELESMYQQAGDRPSVKHFSLENLAQVQEMILYERSDELYDIFNQELYLKRKKVESKINRIKGYSKQLLQDCQLYYALKVAKEKVLTKDMREALEQKKNAMFVRYLNHDHFSSLYEMMITRNKVVTLRESHIMVIEDFHLAQAFKLFHKVLWNIAEEY
ncbi:TPA: hypothetical protein DF272_04265 [Candidatus Falkowbacteria bacterium]|nr:hypothetical protein [Candidatus Falkowbacteria bacterium]